MTTLQTSSASYAEEVARLLWPAPWATPYVTRSRHRRGSPDRDAYLFPSEGRPRLLIPADLPGSSTMLRRLGSTRSPLVTPVRGLLERSVHSRAFSLTRWPILRIPGSDTGADSIERHLAGAFGTEVRVGVMLGTRRANQKPVLQVFDRAGQLLGYAKVGHNDLTAALVRQEAESLEVVASRRPRTFEVPRVLGHDRWAGLEVLVMSALSTDPRLRVPEATKLAAMREVAQLTGTCDDALADSPFWSRLRTDAERLSAGPRGRRLVAALDTIERSSGDQLVTLGSWHGDWGFWNMGLGGGHLMVWDWVRFDTCVPVGFDAIHYAAQGVQPARRDTPRQEGRFLAELPGRLEELGVARPRHTLTLQLYLLEIAVRYEDALTHGPLPSLERRTDWVLDLLEELLVDAGHLGMGIRP
jgi:hypothetical protein